MTKGVDFDVIIVGSGIAGLYTALSISKKLKILLVTKGDVHEGSSYLAQGGISLSVQGKEDLDSHIQDTLIAGNFKNDIDVVKSYISECKSILKELIKIGINFDFDSSGSLHFTLEGGHARRRILHCGGDQTGRYFSETLLKRVEELENIEVRSYTELVDLSFSEKDSFAGVMLNHKGKRYFVSSQCLVLATGGYGGIYTKTTNEKTTVGDAIALALLHGIEVKHLERIQFHPTAFYHVKEQRYLLLSEALRGEGAYLYNSSRERFMKKYDTRLELATRDVVSKAILEQLNSGERVYLDISHKTKEFILNRFPTIYEKCLSSGYDISCESVPIEPVAHYSIGGIKIDKNSESSKKGIFACGEVAYSGFHGSNRLASNSLLECIVTARRAGHEISKLTSNVQKYEFKAEERVEMISIGENCEISLEDIKKRISISGNIIRKRYEVEESKEYFKMLYEKYINQNNISYEARNLIVLGKAIFESMAEIPSSGCHVIEN
ncbi:MAG: FAD-dependent oxidoreductase [Fusobacteria bacterium]|nr:FAD-dependent oxidoreductase [Fusobacteriota bacterium]